MHRLHRGELVTCPTKTHGGLGRVPSRTVTPSNNSALEERATAREGQLACGGQLAVPAIRGDGAEREVGVGETCAIPTQLRLSLEKLQVFHQA